MENVDLIIAPFLVSSIIVYCHTNWFQNFDKTILDKIILGKGNLRKHKTLF